MTPTERTLRALKRQYKALETEKDESIGRLQKKLKASQEQELKALNEICRLSDDLLVKQDHLTATLTTNIELLQEIAHLTQAYKAFFAADDHKTPKP
jgi:hypothetical protein